MVVTGNDFGWSRRVALIGGRGFAGGEFLGLMQAHPALELAVATSGSRAGMRLREVAPGWTDPEERLAALKPEQVAGIEAGIWVLALPNGASPAWVQAIEAAHPRAVIIDLGSDFRHAEDWVYGLTEWNRAGLAGARRIANPGCYATGAQFGLLPIRELLAGPPVIFGVSGYSGAGRAPTERNDPQRLADNLIPYALTGHGHELEISARLGRPVRFHPHVAQFFRGISLTIAVKLTEPATPEMLLERFADSYSGEPLIRVATQIPEIRGVAGSPSLHLGGFAVDARDSHRASFVVVLDNLLKGAASQALQNINVSLGLDELAGVQSGKGSQALGERQ